MYDLNQLKARNLLVMFISAAKQRQAKLPADIYEIVNNIVVYSIGMPHPEKKETLDNKFTTQTANILVKIIGKKNHKS